ncbi:aminotransferase class I/II-fold pyridoxal phosphate-dependent enzyme [Micromonospora sp. WMMD1082]|uniref:aminotransferase class I/II-fold pyridoxal phosphate-dependent enzyme n=1 Tax=Micromonospora sp. WMMD1082 TaxID=3016104 RepID=UPI00241738EA|nr:aminotransferase class I/II-fold pyridoxal phosphate-dependent enzyme [Micromonospora sp. WMMD1082]MDG4797025.1 aminotransferase class I/II-fold pyridoxal phosphate-dependent enzyme [Micromonospora sp. WMMD1082]
MTAPHRPYLTLEDLASAARATLPADIWDFVEGGAGHERTLAANRQAFGRIRLRPRVLTGVTTVDPGVTVLGRRWAAPVGIAPMAYHTLVHPDGELASARAAGAHGVPLVVSTMAGRTFAEIRAQSTAPLWLQLYPLRDPAETANLVGAAERAGFEALVLTVDVPCLGRRLRDLRNGFRLPDGVVPVNLPASWRDGASRPAGHAATSFATGLTWDTVARLCDATALPVIVKGVLTAEDARLAVAAGVAGLVVSNHGGRQLDGVPAAVDALSEVVRAVDSSVVVLLDGGVRGGGDVLAALALGATAVFVGRPVLHGLAVDGEQGVGDVLRILIEETTECMLLAGLATVAGIGPATITAPAIGVHEPAGGPPSTGRATDPVASAPPSTGLHLTQLHASLRHPVLRTMTFLNEIVARYPKAVSFAPGRPFEDGYDLAELTGHLRAYLDHRCADGHSETALTRELFQYGPTAGTIRDIVARTVTEDEAIRAAPEAYVITVGAQEGLLITVRALCAGPDDVLLVPDPCYTGITGVASLLGVTVLAVPETGDGPDPAYLDRLLVRLTAQGRRARLLYLVPDAANPSGTTMSRDARERLLRVLRPHGTLVLEDSPYRLLCPPDRPPTLKALDRHGQVVHVGSFAKSAFPGARVGYVIADQVVHRPDGVGLLADELSKIKSMVTVNTSPVSQALVGGLLLRAGHRLGEATAPAARRYSAMMRLLRTELDRHFPPPLRQRLGVDWNDPDGGFFLSLTVPFVAADEQLDHCAREYGVLWTPMSYFHVEPGAEAGLRAIRLSVSYLTEQEIVDGVGRLARFITDTIG